MKMRLLACCAFFLNTLLFATYYAVAKEALGRIDPIIFTYFEMMALVPVALCIIVFCWQDLNKRIIKHGIIVGSSLCLALFTIAIALKYASATSTAFFPALNGFLAAFAAWLFLRQPISKGTWFAGLLSLVGTLLLIFNSPVGGMRGTLIAFLGGLFFTGYVFLSEHEQKEANAYWPLFGVELLTMALWANLIALLFGDWQAVHPILPKDVWVILYVAGACTFLPTLITVLMQNYISAVTVSFIYILEPVLGAIISAIYLHESLPLDGYLGGTLIVAGAIVQAWTLAERGPRPRHSLAHQMAAQAESGSFLTTLIYPAIFLSACTIILYELGGFPPLSWLILYHAWANLPALMQQGQPDSMLYLIIAQAFCWLIAWGALVAMALIALYRIMRQLFLSIQSFETVEARRR